MKSKAFSLIELLVVMAIMAILIGLSAFGLQQAREASRDGQRKADLETIRTGLSMYKSDCNAYPTPNSNNIINSPFTSSCTGVINTYIQEVPVDPLPGNAYTYSLNGSTYRICAALETDLTADSNCTISCGSTCTYSVINP